MKIVKVTRKYQITIPKEIREILGIKEGDLLSIEEKDGVIIIRKLDILEPGEPVGEEEYKKIIEELEEERGKWR